MRKLFKKSCAMILGVTMLASGCIHTFAAEKLPAFSSGRPLVTYTYQSSGKVYAYTDEKLTKKMSNHYIASATDECKIIQIKGNAVQVSYPTSRGNYTAWFRRDAFTYQDLSKDGAKFKKTAEKQIVTYRWKNNNTTFGYISPGDIYYVLRGGTYNGEWTQVIYPLDQGGYKMGWIKWSVSKTDDTASGTSSRTVANVSEGYYVIKSAINGNYVLDINDASSKSGANLQIYKRNNSSAQIFYLKKCSDGYYTLQPKCSPGLVIDVWGDGTSNGTNLAQYTSHGGDNQKFQILKTSDGYYSFKSKSNGLFIDVNGGIASNGTNVQCWKDNFTAAQKFLLDAVTVSGNSDVNSEGGESVYKIASAYLGKSYPYFNGSGFHWRAWCADFVSFCAKKADQTKAIPSASSVSGIRTAIKKAGGKEYSKNTIVKGNYVPKRGDIIIFKSSGASHVGIVDCVKDKRIYYIDGNNTTNGNGNKSCVHYSSCSYTDSRFTCVMHPNY